MKKKPLCFNYLSRSAEGHKKAKSHFSWLELMTCEGFVTDLDVFITNVFVTICQSFLDSTQKLMITTSYHHLMAKKMEIINFDILMKSPSNFYIC